MLKTTVPRTNFVVKPRNWIHAQLAQLERKRQFDLLAEVKANRLSAPEALKIAASRLLGWDPPLPSPAELLRLIDTYVNMVGMGPGDSPVIWIRSDNAIIVDSNVAPRPSKLLFTWGRDYKAISGGGKWTADRDAESRIKDFYRIAGLEQ